MTKLIFDCDPGVDDAIALFLAFASPELELLAITTTAGNVSASLTARNAAIIRQIAGREDVPIHAGADRPLFRAAVEAGAFHGESGLGPLELFTPAKGVEAGHAAQAIVDIVMAHAPGEVTLAVTGPCTNLALAMQLEPTLAARLGPVVVMGGARREGGNITASAEFNIFADPHAAQVVFASGARCVVMGLDVTHQVRADPARTAAIAAIDRPAAKASTVLLEFSNALERDIVGGTGAPIHDPCVIAYLLAPQLFTLRRCDLQVETSSPLTLGHTAVEFRLPDPAAARIEWATGADADGVFTLLTERLAR
ncbi:nucleoside hydrolase [Phenylobacterium koreense]|uniref:Purine nucleosidase n=1 Tax=Phenylobacterium koreense TaxID=266125 RepID=A0ABV2ENE1_9CAUL